MSVRSDLLGEVVRLIEFTQIATYDDPTSALVVAGRLISESVPCRLGDRAPYAGPYTIYVPKAFLIEAEKVLNDRPVSDSELTELALRTPPEADPPS